jgi:hypothetical protein
MSPIRAVLMVLLLVAARQEEAALGLLIEQLSDDRVDVRSKAVEELSRFDPARLPELKERQKGLDPETGGRLAEAIRAIEDRIEVLQYLPAYRPVTVRLERTPARVALKDLADRTGLLIDLATCPEGHEVSVNVEQVPPLEALTAICKSALLGWTAPNAPDWRGRTRFKTSWTGIRIHAVVPYYYRPRPVAYVRHYRISANLNVTNFSDETKQEFLDVRIEPAPGVRPHSVSAVQLTCAQDESGRNLLPFLSRAPEGFWILQLGQTRTGISSKLARPDPPAHRIARLSGKATFRYPRKVEWVSFKPWEHGVRTTALGCEFRLCGYSRQGASHEVNLEILYKDWPLPKANLEMHLPFDTMEVEVVTQSKERLWSNGSSGQGGKAGWQIVLDMKGSKDEAAVEVRLPYAERLVDDVVEFDLQDIPLDPTK